MTKKRLLTIDDLVKFCSEQKFTQFNSKESGYKIAVQLPTTFEAMEDTDDDHRGMVKIKCRVLLEGKNRNGSYVSRESAEAAAPTIKDRPLLAYIHKLDDGSWDFESHNMTIVENDDGEEEIEYIERQIGSFSNEDPFWETDEETGLNYLCAYAWIAEEYTKAAEILRNKNGFSKSSCELCIEEMAFQAKEKYLDLQKFYVSGTTLLGSHDDGAEVNEGMQGAGVSIVDFSEQNNSVFTQEKVFEILEEINQKIDHFNIEQNLRKEENQVDENKIEVNEEVVEEESTEEVVTEESTEETPSEDVVVESEDEEKFAKTFELSHGDIRIGLYALLESFESTDNEFYYITNVYDDHFVYEGLLDESHVYDQKYTKDGDTIAFDGERVHMNKALLTDSEYAELNAMRSNYAEIQAKLAQYEAEPEKVALLESEDYSKIKSTSEYAELAKKESYFVLDTEDLAKKLDEILLTYAKKNNIKFEVNDEKTVTRTVLPMDKPKKSGRYGGLFRK